jgi:hypothetical protein
MEFNMQLLLAFSTGNIWSFNGTNQSTKQQDNQKGEYDFSMKLLAILKG